MISPESGHHSPDAAQLDDESVIRVLQEYRQAVEAGDKPDRQELLGRHPRIAAELAACLDALDFVHDVAPRLYEKPNQAAALEARAALSAPGALSPAEVLQATPLGDFRIRREIGRGGMGVVYEAEQISLGRRVALKVLPFAAALDAKQLQRFHNEATAAAQLHHQNIVPIYAVGAERGVHYYAMQYIEGQTVAAIIGELRRVSGRPEDGSKNGLPENELPKNNLPENGMPENGVPESTQDARAVVPAPAAGPPPALDVSLALTASATPPVAAASTENSHRSPAYFRTAAQLGVQAAETLEHAHQIGVIHRDIKPANLLVDVRGNLWITDFGLAQIHGDDQLTLTGDLVGTLRYMSPEQSWAKRVPVDHRADIYSLGVTLYEMLTLQPAFTGQDRPELLRQIAFEEPRPPRRINQALPLELETIVLKAMAKNPAERYASGQEFADDLRRFLEDKPIRARRPTPWQRLKKWARRHRAVVTAAVVSALAALTLSTVLIALAYYREAQQRGIAQDKEKEAETNFQTARDVVDKMLVRVAEELANRPQMEELRQELLQEALALYQRLLQGKGTDPLVRLRAGEAHVRVGLIYFLLGQENRGLESYAEGIALLEALVADFPAEVAYRVELAHSHTNMGNLLRRLFYSAKAEQALRAAQRHYAQLPEGSLQSPELQGSVVVNDHTLAIVLRETLRLEEAETAYRQLFDRIGPLSVRFPNYSVFREVFALGHNNLGFLLQELGRIPEAEQLYRNGKIVLDQLVARYPTNPQFQVHLAHNQVKLGLLLMRTGRETDAEEALRLALALQETLVEDFPHIPIHRNDLAFSQSSLAELLLRTGRVEEAEKVFRQALATHDKLTAKFPGVFDYRRDAVSTYMGWGELLADTNRKGGAEKAFRKAVEVGEKLAEDFPAMDHKRESLAKCTFSLAAFLVHSGRGPEAEPFLHKALALWDQLALPVRAPENLNGRAAALHALGMIRCDRGQGNEAVAYFEQALAAGQQALQANPQNPLYRKNLSNQYSQLGRALQLQGKLDEAVEMSRRAVDVAERLARDFPKVPRYESQWGTTLNNLAYRHMARKEWVQARPLLEQAILHQRAALQTNPRHPLWRHFLRSHYLLLGETLVRLRVHSEAALAATELIKIVTPGGPDTVQTAGYFARCVPLALKDAQLPAEKRQALARSYGDQAIALLREALARGSAKAAELRDNPVFQALREHEDFQKLLAQSETKKGS